MEKQADPRSLVVDILLAVDRGDAFSHEVIRETQNRYSFLPRRDRAFIKRLSEGCIERRMELDYILNQFSDTEVTKMKPVIRAILRSGVYQLLYMDTVPDSAVCNEAVRLAKQRGFAGLSGFVNGVLRNIARHREEIAYPPMEEDPVRALSVRYSMPEWITARLLASYGSNRCEQILTAFLQERPLCVRVDTRERTAAEVQASLKAQGIRVRVDSRLPYAFHLDGVDTVEGIPEFQDGTIYVQDVASMMVIETAQPREGDHVLDLCAAPGGKTIHAAQWMNGTGMVTARDRTEEKVNLILENARRCRVSNVRAEVWDARKEDPAMEGAADLVLADVPCSGLGVAGHKTDVRYRVFEQQIRELCALQREILHAAAGYVRPGGILLYSTCTVTEEENQGNIRWFLSHFPAFTLETERQYLPDEACDGFYIAKLRREKPGRSGRP